MNSAVLKKTIGKTLDERKKTYRLRPIGEAPDSLPCKQLQ